jgi:hypothetical protein
MKNKDRKNYGASLFFPGIFEIWRGWTEYRNADVDFSPDNTAGQFLVNDHSLRPEMNIGFLISRLSVMGLWWILAGPGVSPALAVQSHGGAEGLVAHQIGHLLFTIGMGYLLLRAIRLHLTTNGWPCFKIFLVLILLWNLQTFISHWLNEMVDPAGYLKENGRIIGYTVNGFADALFYLSQFDHLLLVPACIMLLIALIRWRRES